MSMIADLDRKVVERFLATPASRLSIVLSQVVRSAFTSAIQALIILLVSIALGVHIHAGVLGWLVILAVAMLVNSAFAGISQAIALLTRRDSTMIAVANFISLPLLFLSTTFLARSQMPHWMRVAARFNPVNWGVNAARAVALPGTDWGAVGVYLLLLLALTTATAGLATWAFRSYKNTL
jgi:ABC-2 type transport system permease protein